jgi:hypothetical protein
MSSNFCPPTYLLLNNRQNFERPFSTIPHSMKNLSQFIQLSSIALMFIFFVASCSLQAQKKDKDVNLNLRALSQKSYPEMYHYKTIASFAKGESIGELPEMLEDRQISLAVVYDSDAPWAEVFNTGKINQTGNYIFNQLLNAYKMSIRNQFQIDGYNECLILDLNAPIEDVAQACKDISTIDHILVVNIKQWPSPNGVNAATAASH